MFTREHTSIFGQFLNLRFFSGFVLGFFSGFILGFLIAVLFDIFSEYRKLRTYEFAQATGYALFLFYRDGRVVAFLVEFFRKFEDLLRAVFHAERATFAQFLEDMDLTARRFDGV
jgi:hypothetical protein